jgi:hypothetical protein
LAEQATIEPAQLDTLRIGIAEGVSAVVAVAQTSIVSMMSQGENPAAEVLIGLVRAVQDNRETFEMQVLGLALETHFAPETGK